MIQQRVLAVLSASLALSACGAGLGKVAGTPASAPGEVDPAQAEASRRNPFLGAGFFLDPEQVAKIEAAAQAAPSDAMVIRKVKQYPIGLWLDSIAKVAVIPKWLNLAKKQQQASGQPTCRCLWSTTCRTATVLPSRRAESSKFRRMARLAIEPRSSIPLRRTLRPTPNCPSS